MMELKVSEWKEFKVNRIFLCETTILSVKDVLDEGSVPFISRTAENNGCDGHVDVSVDAITKGHCLTVGAEGIYCFYQPVDFATGNKVYTLRNTDLTMNQYLFIATILNQEDYKYNYGRARIKSKLENEILRLPIQHDVAGQPVIDPSRKYSDGGYVPDWDFMEQYMKSLNTQPLVTQRGGSALPTLGVDRWKEFQVGRLFDIFNGKGITAEEIDEHVGDFEAVQSGESNNGVMGLIDKQYCQARNYTCCDDACLVVARSGTAGFVSFHGHGCVVGDSAKILRLKNRDVSTVGVYLFLQTLLLSNRFKYTYGRKVTESLYGKTVIRLPVQRDVAGQPVIDPSRKYSDDGHIPDWAFMEQYIGSLPGSDLI